MWSSTLITELGFTFRRSLPNPHRLNAYYNGRLGPEAEHTAVSKKAADPHPPLVYCLVGEADINQFITQM